jgi:hypothetical protein
MIHLIRKQINPNSLNFFEDFSQVEKVILISQEKRLNVIDEIYSTVLELYKEKEIEQWIRFYQRDVCLLLERLAVYNDVDVIRQSAQWSRIYRHVVHDLISILDFLEVHFRKYLDPEIDAPLAYKEIIMKQLKKRLSSLNVCLEDDLKNLLDLALTPVYQFFNGYKKTMYSFKEVHYLSLLVRELTGFDYKNQDAVRNLQKCLIGIDFNTKLFVNYLISNLQEDMSREDCFEICLNF